MKSWLKEYLAHDYKIEVGSQGILEQADGPFPIELHATDTFGKVLHMGGHFMTSTVDEFVYHELMTHPALCTQWSPKRVLVIGGGDGGAVEEILKHPCVEEVVLVEIDQQVIDFSHQHLQEINKGKLFDPRVKIVIADGYEYVFGAQGEQFDTIVLDLTDPEGPAEKLYTREFFAQCKNLHRDERSKFMLHLGPVWTQPKRVTQIYKEARATFNYVRPFMAFVPLYGTLWTFAVCEQILGYEDHAIIDHTLSKRKITDLKYYNGLVHRSMFDLPTFVDQVIYFGK